MERKDFLEFGPFRVDIRQRALSREGQPVPLPAKAFDVLWVLLRRPGQTVTKDELMKEVWPDTFVEEGNLTQMVFLLRKALGESDGGQSLIVTVPRKGYRFVGDVTNLAAEAMQIDASPDHPAPDLQMAGERGGSSSPIGRSLALKAGLANRWRIGAAIAILSGLGGWWIARYQFREPRRESRLVRYTIAPHENMSFRAGKISPDGGSLALLEVDTSGKGRLWVRRLDTLVSRPVSAAEYWPFWSPDSRFIAFAEDGKLKKITASGGMPQTICNAALVVGGSWNRDGTIIYSDGDTLFRVPANGGEAQPLTRLDASRGETTHDFPSFLPDGRHFVYTIHSRKRENGGIYVGSLDSPDSRIRLIADVSNAEYSPGLTPDIGYLLFARSGTLMGQRFSAGDLRLSGEAFPVVENISQSPGNLSASFNASEDGVLLVTPTYLGDQVTWFDRAGTPLGTVGKPGLPFTPQISPDERTVAIDEMDAERFISDIWLFPVGEGTPSRLTFHGSLRPVWSPDSVRIAFEYLDTALYTKTAAGTDEETRLLAGINSPDDYRLPCEWSRDGRFLIYAQRDAKTGYDLWMLPLDGDRQPRSFLHADYNEWCGTLSPDSKWIAYASDESGRSEIYVQAFSETGAGSERKSLISDNGGHWPKWRRDGRELLYLDSDREVVGVKVTSGATFRKESSPQRLFPSGIRTPDPRFDVTADGQRILIPTAVREKIPAPATIIMNWEKDQP